VVLTAGARILFAIPWGERVILGTTDTDYTGSLEDVRAEPDDIAYVLQIVNEFFPTARILANDIISTWAGLRPLIADAHGCASDISRAHEIRNPECGWWDVAGGKLTTYRLIAEQAVDQIAAQEKWRLPRCATAEEPLLKPEETAGVSGILPPPWSKGAVAYYCAHEWAAHLDDVMVRRTSWHYYYEDAFQKAAQVAAWMAECLGWETDEQGRELSRYRSLFPPQSQSPPSMPRLITRPDS